MADDGGGDVVMGKTQHTHEGEEYEQNNHEVEENEQNNHEVEENEQTDEDDMQDPVTEGSKQGAMERAQFVPAKHKDHVYLKDDLNFLYRFRYKKKHGNGDDFKKMWCCLNHTCKATAFTLLKPVGPQVDEFFSGRGKMEHNHVVDLSKEVKLVAVARLRKQAVTTPSLKPRAAFMDLSNTMMRAGGSMGTYKPVALAKQLQRDRAISKKNPRAPKSFLDLMDLLPDRLKVTSDGKAFLKFAGPVSTQPDAPSMLFYMSAHGAARLEGARTWFLDGTFKTAPQLFKQLYVVSAECQNGKAVPAAWALLPDKKSVTYKKLWAMLKAEVEFGPYCAVFDMEQAATNTFMEEFVNTYVHVCFFHLRKALRDQLRRKGADKAVSTDDGFNLVYRLIVALPFVPLEKTSEVFDDIIMPFIEKNSEHMSKEARQWIEYYQATYMGGLNQRSGKIVAPKIPIKMWSQNSAVLQGLPTTNNASEGWNSAFNATCTGNDIFWSTADRLIEEEGLAVTRWREALTEEAMGTGSSREKKMKKKHDTIERLCQRFDTIDKNHWDEWLVTVYSVLLGD